MSWQFSGESVECENTSLFTIVLSFPGLTVMGGFE